MTGLGTTPFLTAAMLRQGAALRSGIDRASLELTTGVAADTAAALRGDFSALAGIDHSLARISAYAAATAETGLLAEAAQTAMATISGQSDELAGRLLQSIGSASGRAVSLAISTGAQAFTVAVNAINAQVSGRSIFGGIEVDTLPLPDADTLLDRLAPVVAGATGAEAAMTAIADWFNDAAGYGDQYRGGPARSAGPVAEGESAQFAVTALDPALSGTLAGLAAVALLDRGLLASNPDARIDLARRAGEALISSSDARVELRSEIGVVQARIADATSRNAAEKTALGIARLALVEADPYETAVRLQDLQTRLDAFYILTSRLSSLSLTEYLR
ncbi:MAG: flagellar biosynthesis protein FlgL [Rhodobacteraceae bacterium]|jgi:flagellar hook-associated protein 3 FlgL|nr:flagellar biosynthesis protein FlgL [Paracoccaceae bacterium]